jgi:3-oxoacyl-[acyl-carrier-protein] synthase-3
MATFAKIAGTGSYLPENRIDNHLLVKMLAEKGVDTSDEWIVTRSGINARHFATTGQMASDLAVIAAKNALESAQLEPNQIDLIIVATSTPDHLGGFPSTASSVQRKLGVSSNCGSFDVQAVCSGFIYATHLANALIKSGTHQRILVIGTEVFSRILDMQDRTTCVLFGDGAGAVIFESADESGIISSAVHSDGNYQEILQIPGYLGNGAIQGSPFLKMDGQAVFKAAVKMLEQVANEVLEKAGLTTVDIDWLIPHQANIRIMEGTAKKLGISLERVIVTLSEQGNTSAASIPLALDAGVRQGKIQRGQNLLLEGVGGGFTWGAACIRY